MPSFFAAVGATRAERDPLGRWSAGGSDDYVRTYKALIRNLYARFRKAVVDGDVGRAVDEGEALRDARRFILQRAVVNESALDAALADLWLNCKEVYTQIDAEEDVGALPLPAAGPSLAEELSQAPETGGDEEGPDEAAPYLIALSNAGRVLKLHLATGCYMAKRRAFTSYEECFVDPPPVHLYTSYCRVCWPGAGPGVQHEMTSAGNAEDSSTSSSENSSTEYEDKDV